MVAVLKNPPGHMNLQSYVAIDEFYFSKKETQKVLLETSILTRYMNKHLSMCYT